MPHSNQELQKLILRLKLLDNNSYTEDSKKSSIQLISMLEKSKGSYPAFDIHNFLLRNLQLKTDECSKKITELIIGEKINHELLSKNVSNIVQAIESYIVFKFHNQ